MKKQSAAAILLAVLFVFLPLTACSASGSFTVLAEGIPDNLDPQLAATAAEKTAVVNLFEGLYRRGTGGSAVLAAAESVDVSGDERTYTFTLRAGMEWASYKRDGETVTPAVTADDFAFAFERIFDKHTGSPWASEFANIQSVAAKGDLTLVVTLHQPDAGLPEKLCSAGAMPCNREFFEYTAGAYALSYARLLTNGPFSIYSWSPGERLTLERNEKSDGWVDTVNFSAPEKDGSGSFTERYAAGEGSGAMVSAVQGDEGENFQLTTWALLLNTNHEFLADGAVRAALAAVAIGGPLPLTDTPQFSVAEGLVPGGVPAGDGSYRAFAGNVMEFTGNAQTQMREAVASYHGYEAEGYPSPPQLVVLVPDSGGYAEVFAEVHQRWQRQLSCYFVVEPLPMEDLLSATRKGDYDIALVPYYAETSRAADMLAACANGGTQNGWQSDAFNTLAALAQAAADDKEANGYAKLAETALLAEWPLVPLVYETTTFAMREAYAGVSVYPFGPVLDFSAPA